MALLVGTTRRRLLAGAALLTAALSLSPHASAGDLTLDFDDLAYTFLGAGDTFEHKGLHFSTVAAPDIDPGSLVGGIFDGNDPSMCERLYCPVNNFTTGYFAGLNDGVLVIDQPAKGGLSIKSFDASFIGSFERQGDLQNYPDVAGLLEIRGYAADGSFISEQFNLEGVRGQEFYMSHYETSAGFASHNFTEIAFFAYSCDFDGQCVAFENNAGQFALDNVSVNVSAVPEPSTWLMLLAGLGTVSYLRRRRPV
jgi:hypothetical protein